MTDKQAAGIKTAMIGGAFFIGGALLGGDWGTAFLLTGGALMVKELLGEPFVLWWNSLQEEAGVSENTDINKEQRHDTN